MVSLLSASSVLAELESWSVAPADPAAHYTLADYRELVAQRGDGALLKGQYPQHLTSSLFVLSPDLAQILLAFHKKAGMWLQFGGHLEISDGSLKAAAWREGTEESGLQGFADFLTEPADLDVHQLGGGFGRICHEHWDVGFVAIAHLDATTSISDESADLGWFPINDLPGGSAGNMIPRVAAAVALAQRCGYPRED